MEHTLVFLLPLAGILIGAKIAGQLSHRIGLPAVFGELMLGLILGPAVLGLMQNRRGRDAQCRQSVVMDGDRWGVVAPWVWCRRWPHVWIDLAPSDFFGDGAHRH